MARLTTTPKGQKKPDPPPKKAESGITVAKFDAKFKPKPPNGLNKWTKQAFKELVETLRDENRLYRRDLPIILQYALSQGVFLKILETTQKPGYKPYLTRQGGYSINPDLQVMQRAADDARAIYTTYFRIGHSVRSIKEVDTASGDRPITQANPEQSEDDYILFGSRKQA